MIFCRDVKKQLQEKPLIELHRKLYLNAKFINAIPNQPQSRDDFF